MKEFIKDLQERLGTKADGALGNNDKAAFDKIDFQNGQKYSALPIIRWAMWCKGNMP